jgi:putative nucleotidyltransferase with HDIG domain
MTPGVGERRRAPRLVVQILGFGFGMIAAVLVTVFVLLSWQTRERFTRAIVENMEASQLRVADAEARRQSERRLQASALAENPTLKAAVDTYHAERSVGGSAAQLLNTIQLELEKLHERMQAPALAVTDPAGIILASTGDHATDWPRGGLVTVDVPAGRDANSLDPVEAVAVREAAVYFATIVPLTFGPDVVGEFVLASPVDVGYARQLARETSTDIVVQHGEAIIASSIPDGVRDALGAAPLPADGGGVTLAGDEFVVRRLLSVDSVSVYALGSVSAPVRAATAEAAWVFIAIGCGALVLAAGGSWWVARTLASPIDQLRMTLQQMADARDFERPLPPAGASFELDALTVTFDGLRASVAAAEAESEAAYLGVIGALAAALDARDPYTAGHSERVARLSVSIGRAMRLPEAELEVLHLGALLHDIGKIGVSDLILRKPGTLTEDEFEQIKRHPGLGARILRPLNFLAEHVAIVELHHEQPDGCGYPYGLKGDDIPVPARIVHVADAFDAMTSARAYRPGRPAHEAIAELCHHGGTGFDLEVVQAITGLPVSDLPAATPPVFEAEVAHPTLGGLLVPFRLRAAGSARRRQAAV